MSPIKTILNDPIIKKEIQGIIKNTITPYVHRIVKNLGRVSNLVGIYNKIFIENISIKGDGSDILRAAVVLLHASLEDFLRVLSASVLPYANVDVLSNIPLVNINQHGRPEKFGLGELSKHKGKTVENLIEESVSAYLERVTFNNTDDISSMLRKIGIDVDDVNKDFSAIDSMIKRRHQIVHKADRLDYGLGTECKVDNINPIDVLNWLEVVLKFMEKTLTAYAAGKNLEEIKRLFKEKNIIVTDKA